MAHDHSHDHGHGQGHSHDVDADSERRVLIVLVMTASFMLVEVVGGLVSGSLALLADAGHMLTDAGALALALIAFRLGRRPADLDRSYGYHRFKVIAAFANGVALVLITLWITIEAIIRFVRPVTVEPDLMMAVAAIGLLVNIFGFVILHRGDRSSINLRGASLHVLGDMLGSVAALAAGVVIYFTGWMPIDPILSLLICGLIVYTCIGLVRQSAHILLEGTPDDMEAERVREQLMAAIPEIDDVHHLHIWLLTEGRPLMTLHVTVGEGVDQQAVLHKVSEELAHHFGVEHATIQVEIGPCPEVQAAAH
jgi:cobalt-zinc-cadmium efflux system protein